MKTKPIDPLHSLKLGKYIGELLCQKRSDSWLRWNGEPVMFVKCYGSDDGNSFDAWFLVGDKINKIHLWAHEFCDQWEVVVR